MPHITAIFIYQQMGHGLGKHKPHACCPQRSGNKEITKQLSGVYPRTTASWSAIFRLQYSKNQKMP